MLEPDHVTLEQARFIAEDLLGRRPEDLEPYRPPVGGDDSYSFRLTAGGQRMLLKVKRRAGSPIGVCFHRRLKEAGLPVPELLAFSGDADPGGRACAIWEWIDGQPAEWGPGEPCPYDEAELGELLRRIHDLRFDGPFGLLGDDPASAVMAAQPDLGPRSTSWPGFFHCDRAAQRYLDRGYLERAEADTLASLPDRLDNALGQAEPRLLHLGDIMFHGNLIVEPATGRILAIVDTVESMAGDPRWELAWFDYYFSICPLGRPTFDMARFRAAYGTDHDPWDRTGRFYLMAILLFEKLLFFDPASPRGRWAVETVKGLLASLQS